MAPSSSSPPQHGYGLSAQPPMKSLKGYLIAVFALVTISILGTAVVTYLSLKSQLLRQQQEEVSRSHDLTRIQNQLVQPFLFSKWMSRDAFLLAWLKSGEKTPELALDYLETLAHEWDLSAFVASNLTKTYYFSDGSSKALTEDAADVGWFFHLLEKKIDTLADVGYHNGDPDQPFLYIDIRMPDINGTTSAYVGTAVELKRFLGLLAEYRHRHEEELHFINQDGMIILSTQPELVNTRAAGKPWFEAFAHLAHVHEDAFEPESSFLEMEGRPVTISRKWLGDLGWHLYIERDLASAHGQVYRIVARTVGLAALVTALALAVMTVLLYRFNRGLANAFAQIKTLTGILPICCSCKKIRNDRGYWQQLEGYIQEHSDADLSHGICPDCARKLYPDLKLEGLDLDEPPPGR